EPAVRLSCCALFKESRFNSIAIDRASHLNRRSAAASKPAAVLRNLRAVAGEGCACLIDGQIETDLHVLVSVIGSRLDGIDDGPLAGEIARGDQLFAIFFDWRRSGNSVSW